MYHEQNHSLINYEIIPLNVAELSTLMPVLGTGKFKADIKSYKSLETAAIFYSSEPFLKQGIV